MASGTTRWRSNIEPTTSTSGGEQIRKWYKLQGTKVVSASVNATHIKAGTKATAPAVVATSYMKFGTGQYIFFGTKGTAASIISYATALVGNTIAGSLYLSSSGKPGAWILKSTSVASKLEGF